MNDRPMRNWWRGLNWMQQIELVGLSIFLSTVLLIYLTTHIPR